jgi:hypothetical protein
MSLFKELLGFYRLTSHKFKKNAIEPQVTVFRAMKKSSWWENGEPKYDVFLRKVSEEDFSILTRANCGEFCDGKFNSCYGEIGLEAKDFIIRGYKVISTPRENVPQHASVYGMPDQDEAIARNVAFELLECVTQKNKRRYKNKN